MATEGSTSAAQTKLFGALLPKTSKPPSRCAFLLARWRDVVRHEDAFAYFVASAQSAQGVDRARADVAFMLPCAGEAK